MTNLFCKPITDQFGMAYLVAKKKATKIIEEKYPVIGNKICWDMNTIYPENDVRIVEGIQMYYNPKTGRYEEETDPNYFISK